MELECSLCLKMKKYVYVSKKMFETVVKKEGLEFLGWRAVPTVPSVLGKKSIRCHAIYCPSIY